MAKCCCGSSRKGKKIEEIDSSKENVNLWWQNFTKQSLYRFYCCCCLFSSVLLKRVFFDIFKLSSYFFSFFCQIKLSNNTGFQYILLYKKIIPSNNFFLVFLEKKSFLRILIAALCLAFLFAVFLNEYIILYAYAYVNKFWESYYCC